jgi:hypothetical protein
MAAFLLTTGIIMLVLGLVSYVTSMRDHANDESSALSLLPGDIEYESPSGNFRFYFPSDRDQYHSHSGLLFLALMRGVGPAGLWGGHYAKLADRLATHAAHATDTACFPPIGNFRCARSLRSSGSPAPPNRLHGTHARLFGPPCR